MKIPFTLFLLTLMLSQATDGSNRTLQDKPQTVGFCELVKHPKLFFNQPVRLRATIQFGEEASYLSDPACPLSHDEQIGVGFLMVDEKQREALNKTIREIMGVEYGAGAIITVVGVLRNSSRRDFAWYQYRFDLMRIENVEHVTVNYEGQLQAGQTYIAQVRGDGSGGLTLVPAFRLQLHYAVRIEWINLKDFPALKDLHQNSPNTRLVFSVLSDEIKHMAVQRWNRTLRCKIISAG